MLGLRVCLEKGPPALVAAYGEAETLRPDPLDNSVESLQRLLPTEPPVVFNDQHRTRWDTIRLTGRKETTKGPSLAIYTAVSGDPWIGSESQPAGSHGVNTTIP